MDPMIMEGEGSEYSISGSGSDSDSGSSSSNSSSSRSSSSGSESSSSSDSSSMSSPATIPMMPTMVPVPQGMIPVDYGMMSQQGTLKRSSMALKRQKKHKHRHKKIKDPNAPKRARTAFMQFSVRMRDIAKDRLKAENQDPTPKLVAKKLGEMWRGLSDDQKKPYVEEAEKDKKRYMMEKSQYTPTITQATTLAYTTTPSTVIVSSLPPQQLAAAAALVPQPHQQPQPKPPQPQPQQPQQPPQIQPPLVHRHHPGRHHHHHHHHGMVGAPGQVAAPGIMGMGPGPQVMHQDPTTISSVIMNGSESDSSSCSDNGACRRTHKRKKKDPNAPKRNKSPYIIFTEVFRDNVTKELKAKLGSEFTYKEVLKELGRRWNVLNEQEKEQFKILAAEDKKRYEAEIAIYKKKM